MKGAKFVSRCTVDKINVARVVGSGTLDVFATPAMVALMEQAAMKAVVPYLAEGETTVGSQMNCSHLAPSPVGAIIEATAEVVEVEGRKITFAVEAYCGEQLIGNGIHVRYVVDAERFMSKMQSR